MSIPSFLRSLSHASTILPSAYVAACLSGFHFLCDPPHLLMSPLYSLFSTKPLSGCHSSLLLTFLLLSHPFRHLPFAVSTSQSMSVSSPALIPMVNNLNLPGNELPLGASPRKKPRKQQHIISTEESEMMETNSTDEEKNSSSKPVLLKAEKRKSPPKEYIGKMNFAAKMKAGICTREEWTNDSVLGLGIAWQRLEGKCDL